MTIKEEERLGATIAGIMNEVAIIPRGALIKSVNGLVTENKLFEGNIIVQISNMIKKCKLCRNMHSHA